MSRSETLSRKPQYRVPVDIPTLWCVTCEMTLRTEEEYTAHVEIFPAHAVKRVTKLMCPICGREVSLENGKFSEHPRVNSMGVMCAGSGRSA